MEADTFHGSKNNTARVEGQPDSTAGIRGRGIIVGDTSRLIFSPDAGTFPHNTGSCTIWVKILDWDTTDVEHFYHFMAFNAHPASGYQRVLLYKFWNTSDLILLFANSHAASGSKDSVLKKNISEWKRDEWHFIVFTWTKEQYELFIDGEAVSSSSRTVESIPQGWKTITIGNGAPEWGKKNGIGNTAVDEFTIYSKVLDHDFIKDEFEKNKNSQQSSAEKTPGKPVFYASFNNSFDADISAGDTAAVNSDTIFSGEGIKKDALFIKGNGFIRYNGSESINTKTGTCVFWLNPVNWSFSDKNSVQFINMVSEQIPKMQRLSLYKLHVNNELTFISENRLLKDRPLRALTKPVSIWPKNEWRQITFTWSPFAIQLYINGESVAQQPNVNIQSETFSIFQLGSYFGPANNPEAVTGYDELSVYNYAMGQNEVKDQYDTFVRNDEKLMSKKETITRELADMKKNNIALAGCGAYVLTSSFQNTTADYSDNLTDGKKDTVWKPLDNNYPHWIEIHWPHAIQIHTVKINETGKSSIRAYSLIARHNDRWKIIKKTENSEPENGTHISKFSICSADRLRIVIEEGVSQPVLTEIEVNGPPQPFVEKMKPYWKAWHISYPEPDKMHHAKNPRYFRKTFEMKDLKDLQSAVMQFRANDYYKCFLNGTEVSTGSTGIHPVDVTRYIIQGKNIIAIENDIFQGLTTFGFSQLIAELSLNYENTSTFVSTDKTWKCNNKPESGWKDASFNDEKWVSASENFFPPDGPWGKIPYFSTMSGEKILFEDILIKPESLKPGETTEVTVTLRLKNKLLYNYDFIFELGSEGSDTQQGNYLIRQQIVVPPEPSSKWNEKTDLTFSLYIPLHAPHGRVPLHISAVSRETGTPLIFLDAKTGKAIKEISSVPVMRYTAELPKADVLSAVVNKNNNICFKLNDEYVEPLIWKGFGITYDKNHDYFKTGIKIVNLYCSRTLFFENEEAVEANLEKFDRAMRSAVEIDPDAKMIAKIEMRPDASWLTKYPDEVLQSFTGDKGPISFGSSKYLEDSYRNLDRIVTFLMKKPYYKNIIGFQPYTCGTPDSGLGNVSGMIFENDRNKLNIGDYSPGAVQEFRKWLRIKYNNSEPALQKAWKDPKITFAAAKPLNAEMTEAGPEGGLFRDPQKGMRPFDYAEFLSGMVGRYYLKTAEFIKKKTEGKKMVGAYHLYTITSAVGSPVPFAYLMNNNNNYQEMLASKYIDFYSCPYNYDYRRPGSTYQTYIPVETLRLHNKLYIAEQDVRTFIAQPKLHGRQQSRTESVSIMKRDLAYAMVRGVGNWFCEFSSTRGRDNVGWFQDEAILSTITTASGVYKELLIVPNKPTAEIAVIFSPETTRYQNVYGPPVIYRNVFDNTVLKELAVIGTPYDIHLTDDLLQKKLTDQYKLYIFINSFYMNSTIRKKIKEMQKNGKTFLWFYAPGYIDDSQGLRTELMSEITGMSISQKHIAKGSFNYRLNTAEHIILEGIQANKEFRISGFSSPFTKMHPVEFGPVFHVTDAAASVLGTFSQDGLNALAVKELNGWNSIYCASILMDKELLKNIARYAGVHFYSDKPDIYIEANNNLLMLHNCSQSRQELSISLPEKSLVEEIYTGEKIKKSVNNFDVTIQGYDTLVYRLTSQINQLTE